ncbi:HEPN domain-containing protein [Acinetobacter oleivorans]|uniref:HEPN domain-containing protein n=1 Tax=Acinetobacter oleivorans TaxID=1148157 RepID=UPI003AF8A036
MPEILYLHEKYIIDVKVHDRNTKYKGKLTLSPDECYIEIFTEREPSKNFSSSPFLKCVNITHSKTYLLFGLDNVYMSHGLLDIKKSDAICTYSFKFKIKFALFIEGTIKPNTRIKSITFNSKFIKKWTMHTSTQNNIFENYLMHKGFETYSGTEFFQKIQKYGTIGLHYLSTLYTSLDVLESGLKIHPKLLLTFKRKVKIPEIYNEYLKLYQLLSLFNGSDIKADFIEIDFGDSRYNTPSLYFSSFQEEEKLDYTILPLGKDVIFSDLGILPLPLNFFNVYYNLPKFKMEFFSRFLQYKRLNSLEDKFLGYFRLLEKLTAKQECYVDDEELSKLLDKSKSYLVKKLNTKKKTIESLSARISYANKLKYNTEKCIADFYDTLPEYIRYHLEFEKTDLKHIVDLRNNITHAKDYIIDDQKLYKYTAFIHSLLYLAIINLLLDIPLETCSPIARRLKQI